MFLAAGAVSSTIILQRSGLLPRAREIPDSQALYLPFAWIGRTGETGREPGHTLAQGSLVLDDPAVSANPIHITLYTYNDGLTRARARAHPRLSRCSGRRSTRSPAVWSSGSASFTATTPTRRRSWEQGSESVRWTRCATGDGRRSLRRFQRALLRSLAPIGLVPLAPLAEIAPPGGGYHYGASIPMSASAGFGAVPTRSGGPRATRRIHVVDASCFPSVPGGAITFSAMANAHRIATAAARIEPT